MLNVRFSRRLAILPEKSIFLPYLRLVIFQTLEEFRSKVFHSLQADSRRKSSFSRFSVQQYKASAPPVTSTILISSDFLDGAAMFQRDEKVAILESKKLLL